MSKYTDAAQVLRDDTSAHYNCTQSVLLPFAEEQGISREVALKIAANFGGGMRCASTCGAITGGLMVLGLMGVEDPAVIRAYFKLFKDHHAGMTTCAELLKANVAAGGTKKAHCDGMVKEAIEAVEAILAETK